MKRAPALPASSTCAAVEDGSRPHGYPASEMVDQAPDALQRIGRIHRRLDRAQAGGEQDLRRRHGFVRANAAEDGHDRTETDGGIERQVIATMSHGRIVIIVGTTAARPVAWTSPLAPWQCETMQRARPGAANLITDVAGLSVGQATDEIVRTGVTVIVPDDRAVCAVDVRGGAPGTRETDALAQENLVESVDAVVLVRVARSMAWRQPTR